MAHRDGCGARWDDVVRADTYGAYIWNGAEWEQLVTSARMPPGSPQAQGVYELRIAPSDSRIMYMMYGGAVYRTSDKGRTWGKTAFQRVTFNPNDSYRMNGQKLAIDPSDPNRVLVGTPQNGIFETRDGGAEWKLIPAVPSAAKYNAEDPGIC